MEKDKVSGMWQMHCSQLARWDAEGAERDAEIAQLKARIAVLEKAGRVSLPVTTVGVASHVVSTSTHFTPSVTTSSRCFVLPSYTCWSSVPFSGVSSSPYLLVQVLVTYLYLEVSCHLVLLLH